MLATRQATLQSRIAIQILAINDDVQRFHLDLNGPNYDYFVVGILWVYGFIVWLGHAALFAGDISESLSFTGKVLVIVFISLVYGFIGWNLRGRN